MYGHNHLLMIVQTPEHTKTTRFGDVGSLEQMNTLKAKHPLLVIAEQLYKQQSVYAQLVVKEYTKKFSYQKYKKIVKKCFKI